MSCNSTIAWKASLTRMSPPICTSAPSPQLALILKTVGAANGLSDSMPYFVRNGQGRPLIKPNCLRFGKISAAAFEIRWQEVESARRIETRKRQ